MVQSRTPKRFGLDPVRDVQVLCPMNRGSLGAKRLNIELQQALNPPGEQRVERFGWTFCPGDKVMQVANDYERDVFNGDLGIISALDLEESVLTVSFEGAPWSMVLRSWTSWCWPTRPRSTRRRARSIRWW